MDGRKRRKEGREESRNGKRSMEKGRIPGRRMDAGTSPLGMRISVSARDLPFLVLLPPSLAPPDDAGEEESAQKVG